MCETRVNEDDERVYAKLNGETAHLGWNELQRHFARGVVIKVAPHADLVAVATTFARDDATQVQAWMTQGILAAASDTDALRWLESKQVFWAVVAAPWVLVQEI